MHFHCHIQYPLSGESLLKSSKPTKWVGVLPLVEAPVEVCAELGCPSSPNSTPAWLWSRSRRQMSRSPRGRRRICCDRAPPTQHKLPPTPQNIKLTSHPSHDLGIGRLFKPGCVCLLFPRLDSPGPKPRIPAPTLSEWYTNVVLISKATAPANRFLLSFCKI